MINHNFITYFDKCKQKVNCFVSLWLRLRKCTANHTRFNIGHGFLNEVHAWRFPNYWIETSVWCDVCRHYNHLFFPHSLNNLTICERWVWAFPHRNNRFRRVILYQTLTLARTHRILNILHYFQWYHFMCLNCIVRFCEVLCIRRRPTHCVNLRFCSCFNANVQLLTCISIIWTHSISKHRSFDQKFQNIEHFTLATVDFITHSRKTSIDIFLDPSTCQPITNLPNNI